MRLLHNHFSRLIDIERRDEFTQFFVLHQQLNEFFRGDFDIVEIFALMKTFQRAFQFFQNTRGVLGIIFGMEIRGDLD